MSAERRFQPGVNTLEGDPKWQRFWELGIRRMELVLEALKSPGTVVEVPETHDTGEIYAFSVEGIRNALPPPLSDGLCEVGVGEDGRPLLILANGSVIRCSKLEWLQHG